MLWKFIEPTVSREDRESVKEVVMHSLENSASFRDMIQIMKDTDNCELFVEWLHMYFTHYTRLTISDQTYVIKRDLLVGKTDAMHVEETEISNPYVRSLDERAKKQKASRTDIFFMHFIPRVGGDTRYTHGGAKMTQEVLRELYEAN